ncbi:iron chelate uptake ABC transporter family permease subunit [Vibrio mangrovi]|uniref:Ferric enterobactin transport system permease protein FepD n=1 Tax=Vibrio mangrovi TaxID=474394 RepID=A0A1Y6IUG6_9VIBR|nr:iron chelate uptake ABC transporter family permease subunit [Vibrio mangrovi]MDW6003034.1 iron chelate uptake ABC transporter family permease subunit [Vibrio mangrovi]SMS01276.1 Ferric enterobactin transport system permease protein FepD [Vibrio mangrovi]
MNDKTYFSRFWWMIGLGVTGLLLTVFASLSLGAHHISVDVIRTLLDGQCPPTRLDCLIIQGSRIPRTFAGLLAGAALGLAGVLMQTLTRNPLAEPGILGVNAGAGFMVIIGVSFFQIQSASGYVACAFIGAVVTTILVVWCANALHRFEPLRLLLAGVAFGAVLEGIGAGLALVNPDVYDQLRFWQAGSLDVQNMDVLQTALWPVAGGIVLCFTLLRSLNALAMGQEVALNLGTHVMRTQLFGVLAMTLLSASATATVGPLVFVGLLAPHIGRMLVGSEHQRLIPFVLIVTPMLVLWADILGRLLLPGQLRVSVVLAFFGAPILIVLVRQQRRWA